MREHSKYETPPVGGISFDQLADDGIRGVKLIEPHQRGHYKMALRKGDLVKEGNSILHILA